VLTLLSCTPSLVQQRHPLIQKGASPAPIYLAANAAVCNAKVNPADGYVL
jgi:hypothetical protein